MVAVRLALLLCGLWFVCACDLIRTPQQQLSAAIINGELQKVQKLLESRTVDVNWTADGAIVTPLSTAAAFDRTDIAALLLAYGADPNLGDEEGNTPLLSAAYHGNVEICELLIRAGADVNKPGGRYGWTALRNASYKGHDDVVQLLKKYGAER